MLFNIIIGGVCLNEFQDFSRDELTVFIVGASICIFGLMFMLYFDSQIVEFHKVEEFESII